MVVIPLPAYYVFWTQKFSDHEILNACRGGVDFDEV